MEAETSMSRRRIGGGRGVREVNGWRLGKLLGRGGNGEVFHAVKEDVVGAMKLLGQRNLTPAGVARFRDEVEAMRQCADIPGVLPVLDADLEPPNGTQPWFVMGLARPIDKELSNGATLKKVVEAIGSIASVLQAMHARGISHRDIKPANLFFYEGAWAVGDFGLVSFEGKTSETERGERIGPLYYIAPEMLNNAAQADGRCADVFSLAKTLWVLATGQRFPLPGAYDMTHEAFRIGSYITAERTGALDKLIESATLFSPAARPAMSKVAAELAAWLAPRPRSSGPIALDTSRYAAELERRRMSMEAAEERQKRTADVSQRVGLRLREALRPFAKEIETELKAQNFVSVSLSIDNYYWGFEIRAVIPGTDASQAASVMLSVGVASIAPSVQLSCRIALGRHAPTAFEMLLWDKSISFLEGGSEEDLQLQQLCDDIRRALQHSVSASLAIVIDGKGTLGAPTAYQFRVSDVGGQPVAGADILLVGSDGVYLRATTNADGTARIGPTPFGDVVAFIAHPLYRGEVLSMLQPFSNVVLQADASGGSMVCTTGWTGVKGLQGKISLIHDPQRRMYMYGENVAINGGAHQPVTIELGKQTQLQGTDGASVAVSPRAVRGPCFLLNLSVDR